MPLIYNVLNREKYIVFYNTILKFTGYWALNTEMWKMKKKQKNKKKNKQTINL